MKKRLTIAVLLAITSVPAYADQCSNIFTPSAVEHLKQQNFEISSEVRRNETAINLLTCIGHPDPKIRDELVYEGLSYWLRNELLAISTIKSMFTTLINTLKQSNHDANNFSQPFAALVLSEVIRVDRISPYLTNIERQNVVDISTHYMKSIKDYRGFDQQSGWLHSVAHTADVFLQLALNNNISRPQLDQMLNAIKVQVCPQGLHFYQYGEPKRLAMAFIYITLRGEHTELELTHFFNEITSPTPFENWNSVYQSNRGLAKLHNTRNFVYSVWAIIGDSKNKQLIQLKPILTNTIKTLG